MSLAAHEARLAHDLAMLNYPAANAVLPREHAEGHVHDVVIAGGGQSGLGAAFGLLRERVINILVIDENPAGREGPWDSYARMRTLRTPKHLTTVDLGIPALTFRAWWEAQHGTEGWAALDKIPRLAWMDYLRWYRRVLDLPVRNGSRLTLVEPVDGLYRLHLSDGPPILARKVVLATGIQGGGEWHVPPLVADALPAHLYAHTSQAVDYHALAGKSIAVLGGGASAFDNATAALEAGVGQAHVFLRRDMMNRVNPIRFMERQGILPRFGALDDAARYQLIAHFFRLNQPPTNDMFAAASAHPGFRLHLGAPWTAVREEGGQAVVTTPQGEHRFHFLVVSTGLVTDPALRPELKLLASAIRRWGDVHRPDLKDASPMVDAHPYLGEDFRFLPRDVEDVEAAATLRGVFAFNFSALVNFGLAASALSGLTRGIQRLVTGIADQLLVDDRDRLLADYLAYDEVEFTGEWQAPAEERAA